MTPAEKQIVLAAAHLARTAPESWKRLLGAFHLYTTATHHNLISSPLDELPRAQGRAQTARDILALLENCIQSADQIERRNK